jgi:HEAT repeat protein
MFEKLQKSLESEGFRQSAVKTLGKVGNLAVVEALITALSDKDILVRSYAAEALGKIGSPEAIEALITALRDEYLDVDVRGSVAEALGKIGNPEAVETLITERSLGLVQGAIALSPGTRKMRSGAIEN